MRKKQDGRDYPISGGAAMGLYRKESSASRYFAYAAGGVVPKKRLEKSTGQDGVGSGKKIS
jgi:hypothetical protein